MKPAPNPTKRQLAALAALVDGQWTDDALDRLSRDLSTKSRKVLVESEAQVIARLSDELQSVHAINKAIYRKLMSESFRVGTLEEKNEQLTEKIATLQQKLIDAEAENKRMANDRTWLGLCVFVICAIACAAWIGSRVAH